MSRLHPPEAPHPLPGTSQNNPINDAARNEPETPSHAPADQAPGCWPARPGTFPDLLTPVEAAQYLRLDELGTHTPTTAVRTLNYWRDRGQLRATKYARHVWYRRTELDRFLAVKTES